MTCLDVLRMPLTNSTKWEVGMYVRDKMHKKKIVATLNISMCGCQLEWLESHAVAVRSWQFDPVLQRTYVKRATGIACRARWILQDVDAMSRRVVVVAWHQ